MLTTRQKNALKKKNITNLLQLHRWLPLGYIDNTRETGADESLAGKHVVIIGKMLDAEMKPMRTRYGKYISAHVLDRKTGKKVSVTIFSTGEWLFKKVAKEIGKNVLVAGNLQVHPVFGCNIAGPVTFTSDIAGNMKVFSRFSKVKGISDSVMEEILCACAEKKEPESLPGSILSQYNLLEINDAVKKSLFPETMEDAERAKERFLFDDLYYLAGRLELMERKEKKTGLVATSSALTESIIKKLPYQLTEDQQKTFQKIREEMTAGRHIRALVQGDVGCGKTITAFLSMLLAVENGYQALLLAPTKILAEQHFQKLSDLIEGTDLKAVLIVGGNTSKEVLKATEDGTAKLIIGTHSLLSEKVKFCNPGLMVIDEEHKFGVNQRNKIETETSEMDVISMSATPIPRTLALALYGTGTLICSIRSMPNGRKPIKTLYSDGRSLKTYVGQILERGQQVYAVCPMIGEAEEGSLLEGVASAEETVEQYRKMFPTAKIEELDGKTSAEETERILSGFRDGQIDILVSTTVVEVGVDVPNATLMIIHNAERFGLAGMHQLRGRVGRGNKQSFCVLVSKERPEENERIQTLLETSDGFQIAEKDMSMLRKSGNLFGEQQSGRNRYIDEMIMYPKLYQDIRETVKTIDEQHLSFHAKKIETGEVPAKSKALVCKRFAQ